jgi:hypothetical protein
VCLLLWSGRANFSGEGAGAGAGACFDVAAKLIKSAGGAFVLGYQLSMARA